MAAKYDVVSRPVVSRWMTWYRPGRSVPLNGSGGQRRSDLHPSAVWARRRRRSTASGSGASEIDSPTWTTGRRRAAARHEPVEQVLREHRESRAAAAGPTGGRRSRERPRADRTARRPAAAASRASVSTTSAQPGASHLARAADVHAAERDVGQQRIVLAGGVDGGHASRLDRRSASRCWPAGAAAARCCRSAALAARSRPGRSGRRPGWLRRVVAGADARHLGVRSQAERAFDEHVAVADQQHARRAIATQHGPGRVVQRQAVGLIEPRFERVRVERQVVPLRVARGCPDRWSARASR